MLDKIRRLFEWILLTTSDFLTKTIGVLFLKGKPKTLQDERTKVSLPLAERIELSQNTRKFRFRLPSDSHILGLAPGQHVYLSAKIDGKLVVRPYTPVSTDDDPGFVDLVVKVYFAGQNPQFPNGGKMSQHLDSLKVGETVDFRGPAGHVTYHGTGLFTVKHEKKGMAHRKCHAKKISMVAGGSGITPMLQILKAVTKNDNDNTEMKFIFANVTEDDILCRDELEELIANSNGKLKVWYTLSNPPSEWKFSTGRVNEEMFKTHLFPPAEDNLILLCGPPKMISEGCRPVLESMNHDSANILVF